MPSTAELEFADNPYRSTAVAPAPYQDFDASSDEITELCAYVGPRCDYYLRKWAAKLEDPQGDVGIHWVAFFFPSLWMAYRKMYRAVFVYMGIMLLLGAGKELVFIVALHQKQAPLAVTLVFNVLAGLVCALYGNAWYLSQARRTIATLRSRGHHGQELLYSLSKHGGTSILSIFLVNFAAGLLLGFVIIMMAVVIVAVRGV